MAGQTSWEQRVFDETLQRYLERLKTEKIPRALNKKGFFVALRAMAETPKKERFEIARDLARVVIATRHDGRSGPVPVGFAVAAIRAARHWPDKKMRLGERNKSGRANVKRAWLALLRKKFTSMMGGRQAAAGFLRVGWLSVVRELGRFVRDRKGAPAQESGTRLRGVMKGKAEPAQPGWHPVCKITNSAQARTDRRGGLVRIGGPALERAFAKETADMVKFLEEEALREESEGFNGQQKA